MLATYLDFVFRPPSEHAIPTGASAVENFYVKLGAWSFLFVALNIAVPSVCLRFLPGWYKALTERKRIEMPAYVVCMVHHLFLVPVAWAHLLQDFHRTDRHHDYSATESWVSPISLGYLIGDTLGYAIPVALMGRFDYIIHHVLTIWLVWNTVFGPGQILRFIPHLLVCDSTNICFNIAWLLRTTQWKDSTLVTVLELMFAVLFLIVRVINLPIALYAVHSHGLAAKLGWAGTTLLPIVLLQWFWFCKIVSTTVARLRGAKEKSV